MTADLSPDDPGGAAPGARRRVAVVTGGTRGIGLAVARDLSATHDVVVGGRSRESVDAAVEGLPGATGFVADLTECAPGGSLDRALTELAARLDHVDVLVHSAGILRSGAVADLPVEAWTESLTVNVVAVAAVTRALLPALRRAHGLVVTVNSGSGLTASGGGGAYSASKFALRALSDALRDEERAHGVRVTSLHPGRVDTDMQHELVAYEGRDYDPGSYLEVEDVVRAVRLAVDAGPGASVDMVSVRPRGWRPAAS